MAYVIAIAGGSASGKSTLAAAIQSRFTKSAPALTIELLSMDKFMRRTDPAAPHFDFTYTKAPAMDCNHPQSVDNSEVVGAIEASKAEVFILEGLMPLAVPEIRELANLKLFIELEADIRAVRRMERDIRIGRSSDPAFSAAYYIECARVGHHKYIEPSRTQADLIVRGDWNFNRTADLIIKLVLADL